LCIDNILVIVLLGNIIVVDLAISVHFYTAMVRLSLIHDVRICETIVKSSLYVVHTLVTLFHFDILYLPFPPKSFVSTLCVCESTCVFLSTCGYVFLCLSVYICIYMYLYLSIHLRVCVCVCVRACMCVIHNTYMVWEF